VLFLAWTPIISWPLIVCFSAPSRPPCMGITRLMGFRAKSCSNGPSPAQHPASVNGPFLPHRPGRARSGLMGVPICQSPSQRVPGPLCRKTRVPFRRTLPSVLVPPKFSEENTVSVSPFFSSPLPACRPLSLQRHHAMSAVEKSPFDPAAFGPPPPPFGLP